MDINSINQLINDILKDVSKFDIIKDFKVIKNLCINILETSTIKAGIEESNRKKLINNLLKQIIIKGEYLTSIEEQHEERYNLKNNYKQLNELLNTLKLFKKKEINLMIDGIDYNMEVYDTGDEYLPTENILLPEKVLQALKNLKKQEEIERIADILENGIASIYLDPETREKVENEIAKRKLNRKKQKNDFEFVFGQRVLHDMDYESFPESTNDKEHNKQI